MSPVEVTTLDPESRSCAARHPRRTKRASKLIDRRLRWFPEGFGRIRCLHLARCERGDPAPVCNGIERHVATTIRCRSERLREAMVADAPPYQAARGSDRSPGAP